MSTRSVPSARVRAACAAAGRDPHDLTYSAALVACVGASTSEFDRRAAAIGREPDEVRGNGVAGTLDDARRTLARWHAAGAQRIHLQVLDLGDVDHLATLAE